MAKADTKGNLVSYNAVDDAVEVYVQVFFGYRKWKLGVLRTHLDKVRGHLNCKASASKSEAIIDEDQYYSYFAFCILSG